MRIVIWVARLVLFFLLFGFALKNTDVVSLRFFFDTVWQAPLVIVLLIAFAAGALFGLLAAFGAWFGVRRELARLRGQLAATPAQPSIEPPAGGAGHA